MKNMILEYPFTLMFCAVALYSFWQVRKSRVLRVEAEQLIEEADRLFRK